MDAGSSGTRVYVYKWPCRSSETVPSVVVGQVVPNFSVRPGIAKFAQNPVEVRAYLSALVAYAKKGVPEEQLGVTPIFLRATAGMRLLSEAQQEAIHSNVRYVFQNSGFRFDEPSWSRTITGQEEGAFLWLGTNYLYGELNTHIQPSDTRATLDCGGASFQISFEPPQKPSKNEFIVSFVDKEIPTYYLYSNSWLGYGNDEARNAVLQYSVNNTRAVISPCFHKGFNYKLDSFSSNITIIGTGDPMACRLLILKYLNVPNCTDCSINGVYRPKIGDSISITGVGSFKYSGDIWNLTSYTPTQLAQLAHDFCRLPWNQVYKNGDNLELVGTQCFMALYVSELLWTAIGVSPSSPISIIDKVNEVSLTWSLGSILYDIGNLPCSPGQSC